jgi:hypothetical protein
MELTLWFKGENGKLEESKKDYWFDEEGLTKLQQDFDEYSQRSGLPGTKKGGWYKCKFNDKDTIVFLKFDEILYIG